MRQIRRFLRDHRGATAIEYAVIGVLVGLAIISGATVIGQSVAKDFNSVTNGINSAAS